ncbi:MAG: GAF domain-containing protein [Leptolyngbyaceae bacterium]|nr:GAF domain-containing protein [Leptolyngbyaceae bacterium]
MLDLTAVLKASQSISSTIELDSCLYQIAQNILQNLGGTRCVLLLLNGDELQVCAIATPEKTEILTATLTEDTPLPFCLIQHVRCTKEIVIIDGDHRDLALSDPYFDRQNPPIILCSPLLHQDQLKGILYLENQSASGVFTHDCITILNHLCTQAAISLEHAFLYQKDENYIKQLEESIQTLQETQKQFMQDEENMQMQVLAMFELAQLQSIHLGNLEQAFHEITEVTARTVNTSRVSIWLFGKNHTKFQCVDLFDTKSMSHSQGAELSPTDYPYYIEAIGKWPILAAEAAQIDPRTCEFTEGYLIPLNIVSMLDASIYLDGNTCGVVCCEQVAQTRQWSRSEQNFVRSVANLITLALESNRRQEEAQRLEQSLDELAQTQLQMIQQEKMASLGNLVAGVAHEINNPASFLQGNIKPAQEYVEDLFGLIDLYQKKVPETDPEIQQAIAAIDLEFIREDLPNLLNSMNAGVDRIRDISTSLRTFSRKDEEYKTTFNIHDGIDSTLLILKHRTKANDDRPKIRVIKEYGAPSNVQCFPGQLNQVFMNILANAIEAFEGVNQGKTYAEIEANPNCIRIHTLRVDEDYVQIRIQDNGCGMDMETQKRIFEQGFTTKEVGKGTGLGMTISQQIIVQKHGGTLTCDSTPGQGTTFVIMLPIT